MTPEEFKRFVCERVTIRNPPFPIQIRARTLPYDAIAPGETIRRQTVAAYEMGAAILTISVEVRDRATGEKLAIQFEQMIAGIELANWDEGMAITSIREHLHKVVTHEMDEALHVDGQRPFDPHALRSINVTIGLLEGP